MESVSEKIGSGRLSFLSVQRSCMVIRDFRFEISASVFLIMGVIASWEHNDLATGSASPFEKGL